jgi:hypothetical protein
LGERGYTIHTMGNRAVVCALLYVVLSKYVITVGRDKHLREWLFHSRSGLGVTNYSGVGSGVGVAEKKNSGVDYGVDFFCLYFFVLLFYTPTGHP